MTKKELFINFVTNLIESLNPIDFDDNTKLAIEFFEELKTTAKTSKAGITENGIKILQYMQNNYKKCDNTFTSKTIGEGIFASPRSVSGSMKKLIGDGFVNKIGIDPISYSITEKGKSKDIK